MAEPYSQGSESITQAEHISPVKTGDNIQAKRVAGYEWDGSNWKRKTNRVPDHDETVLDYTGGNLTSMTYKLAGTTVGTQTLSYDGSGNLSNISIA